MKNSDSNNLKWRHQKAEMFRYFCIGVTGFAVAILAILIYQVSVLGMPWLDAQFINSFPSRFPEKAGIKSALVGTLWLVSLTAAIAIPVGVLAAVYLEEYAKPTRVTEFININIANLAGVPSIVYGILGLAIFVRFLGLERSVLSGAMTMSLLILPVIILASREAIRAVPPSIRQAAFDDYVANPVDGATPVAIASALARLKGKHVMLGLTRLGDVDLRVDEDLFFELLGVDLGRPAQAQ